MSLCVRRIYLGIFEVSFLMLLAACSVVIQWMKRGLFMLVVSGTIVDTKPLFQMRITVFRLLMKNIFQMIL